MSVLCSCAFSSKHLCSFVSFYKKTEHNSLALPSKQEHMACSCNHFLLSNGDREIKRQLQGYHWDGGHHSTLEKGCQNGTDTMDSERKLPKGNMGHTKGIGGPYGNEDKEVGTIQIMKSVPPHTMHFFELLKDPWSDLWFRSNRKDDLGT